MNDRTSICIVDDPDFKWHSIRGWSDEYCDVRIVGLESSPVVSKCVEHVVIGDTVLASARLDVHPFTLGTRMTVVNIC